MVAPYSVCPYQLHIVPTEQRQATNRLGRREAVRLVVRRACCGGRVALPSAQSAASLSPRLRRHRGQVTKREPFVSAVHVQHHRRIGYKRGHTVQASPPDGARVALSR